MVQNKLHYAAHDQFVGLEIHGDDSYFQNMIKEEEGAGNMEVSKRDWKLYREKLPEWQEAYMERLVASYVEYLTGDEPASEKFWEMEKRIKRDRKNPGVLIELSKQDMPFDLIRLLNEGVITVRDLDDFSDDLKEYVKFLKDRLG